MDSEEQRLADQRVQPVGSDPAPDMELEQHEAADYLRARLEMHAHSSSLEALEVDGTDAVTAWTLGYATAIHDLNELVPTTSLQVLTVSEEQPTDELRCHVCGEEVESVVVLEERPLDPGVYVPCGHRAKQLPRGLPVLTIEEETGGASDDSDVR